MKFRWSIAPPQPLVSRRLADGLGVSPLLAQCLLNRGLTDADKAGGYLEPRLNQLDDPFQLPDMTAAVDRLYLALRRAEPLAIFGDYDVDGVTSTALLLEVLRALGWQAYSYLPHRLEEGYGLSREGVENCLRQCPVRLLLAVDCGSTAAGTVDWLRQQYVDVIVLDHHQVSDPPPAAVALVNPRRPGDTAAASRELCSVGLAFKLAHALVKRGRESGEKAAREFDVRRLLDLVALGTVADLVPLVGENRALVTAGLRRLETTRRPGLVALKSVAGVTGPIGGYEVGFQLGPRLNAAGRLETASAALELLLAASREEAEPRALVLDAQNRERQKIERAMTEQVIDAVRARFNPETDYVIVEGGLLWHIGVVGIVASRVLREFHRPTIILGGDGREWRGSGRSIEGFDLAAALRECDDLLLRHGGHAMAAGLSVHPDKVDSLRRRLGELARRTLAPDQLQPSLRVDGEAGLADLVLERVLELGRLEPVGQGNPPVHLVVRGLTLRRPPQRMGRDQQHSRLCVTDGRQMAEVVCWNCPADRLPAGTFDLAVAPGVNEYNGAREARLRLLDWRPAAENVE